MEPDVSFTQLDRNQEDRFVPLARELGVSTFGLNLVILRPGQRMRIHRHRHQEEAYLVLEGVLTLSIEGDENLLKVDDLARVAPDLRRQLINAGNTTCVVLAAGGSTPHERRDAEAFVDWEDDQGLPPREIPLPDDLPQATDRPDD